MCKVGDIILVKEFKKYGESISSHSFIVISDDNGEVEGLPYDFACNMLSSFKSKAQKERKLSYPGNYEIKNSDTITNPDNGKDGFVKTDQLYLFKKEKIEYVTIGTVMTDVMESLLKFINEGDFEITQITDNL